MVKQRILTVLGIAIVGLSVGSYFAFQNQILHNAPQFGKRVIVTSQTVPVGTVLTKTIIDKDFQFQQIPENYVAAGAVTNPQDLLGKKTLAALGTHEQVTEGLLTNHAIRLSANDRLYAFPIDSTRSVGGDIFPNDIVDVDVFYPKTGQTQTVISGIPVYSVQDANGVQITSSSIINTQSGPAHPQPALVTIAADPNMIQQLQQDQNGGELFLVKYANENLPQN